MKLVGIGRNIRFIRKHSLTSTDEMNNRICNATAARIMLNIEGTIGSS